MTLTLLHRTHKQTTLLMRLVLTLCCSLGLPMLAFAASGTSLATSDEKPDFTGTWVLDSKASDSMGPILEAQGRSRMERKVAENMTVTQYITQAKDQITIIADSAASKVTETLRLDGTSETKETKKMGTVQTRTSWEDNKTLMTIVDMKLSDGSPATMVMRRQLQDQGKTMSMRVELRLKNGEVLKAHRILRRS